MNLEVCLPAKLRGPATTITKIAEGLSGAGVYRVESAGQRFLLKIAPEDEPLSGRRSKLNIQRLAANAGLAPPVIHVDEVRRAVVSAFVPDRGFLALYRDPRTREAALAQLGRTLRRVHELPLPPDAEPNDPRELLAATWSELSATFALPAGVGDAVSPMLRAAAPAGERAAVLSHNDVNPSNLVHDGEHLLLLDWDSAGANDPFFDLGALSVFLRMDEDTRLRLLAAYDGKPVARLPAGFTYNRRLAALLCGTTFLTCARRSGHPGATGADTLEAVPSLGECYQRLRSRSLSLATSDGHWAFGLALVKESAAS